MKFAILATLALAGCTSAPQQMTPEQIKAMAPEAGVLCAHIPTPTGSFADVTIVKIEKGVVQNGSVTCGKDVVTMSPKP